MKELLAQWDSVPFIKVFEIAVIDNRNGENDWVVFDISIDDGLFIAQHIAMNEEQEASELIAETSIEIDDSFDLDENLQELYLACLETVMESDYFTLNL